MSKKLAKKQKGELGDAKSLLDSAKGQNMREVVVKEAEKELSKMKGGKTGGLDVGSFAFKGMTLREFEMGVLLDRCVDKEFGVLATEISRNIQEEYRCDTHDKKILAEMIALNYSRVMAAQKSMMLYLSKSEFTDLGVKYLQMLSKEADRAHRHLTTSLQALQVMNQPPINIKVKANVANVAGQQIVKNENVVKAK